MKNASPAGVVPPGDRAMSAPARSGASEPPGAVSTPGAWEIPRAMRVLFFAGIWTLIGLSFAGQFYISSANAGSPVSWRQALAWSLGDWYVFALLSWPASRWIQSHPLRRASWWRPALQHLIAGAVFSLLYMVLRAWVGQWQGQWSGRSATFADAFSPLLVKTWHFNILIYGVLLAVVQALENARRFQERAQRAAELERGLVQARLQALQMQLNPHFLFNTLHSISTLMHRDVELADRMIARLANLLRYSLDHSETREVTLERELEALELYLDIEQTRFGPRLTTRFDIAPETREALVPNLILQPMVENAVRHGLEPTGRPGQIEILSSLRGGRLQLEIADNGRGWSGASREGVGLSNTRARLQALYGDDAKLEAGPRAEGGSVVRISMPFHKEPRAET